jgi:hypothetical protein
MLLPAALIAFRCVATMPTTSFILETQGEEAVLTTIHHNGTGYMPIHEGVIVPNDLPYLARKAELLKKMGERNEFRFPLANCKVYGSGLLSCHGGNAQVFEGVAMRALSLETSKVTERAPGVVAESVKVRLSVQIDGFSPVQDVVNNFYGEECRLGF